MNDRDEYLAMEDRHLLAQCDVDLYRASGPGGQHRNKVTTAVRLRHGPTGLTVTATESRSQHENKSKAIGRLRREIACRIRRPAPAAEEGGELPEAVRSCLYVPRGGQSAGHLRLQVGRRDRRFWPVVAALLDAMEAHEGRLAPAATALGISTSNLAAILKSERHALAAAQALRKRHGQGPLG